MYAQTLRSELLPENNHFNVVNHRDQQLKGAHFIIPQLNGPELIDGINRFAIKNRYKKNQTLFVQGNPFYGIFLILSGKIKISQTSADGKETIIRIARPNEFLAHHHIFKHESHNSTATAIEDSLIYFLDKKSIAYLIDRFPQLTTHFYRHLLEEYREIEIKFVEKCQKNVRERLAHLLIDLAEKDGGVDENGNFKFNVFLSRENMASIIGTATETLSRFLSELKSEEIIIQKGKVLYIKDMPKLLRFAS